MRKQVGYFAGGFLVILLTIIISYQDGHENGEKRMVAVLGNAVYNVWESYYEIVEDSNREMTIDSISRMNDRLISVKAYSNVVDRTVGEEVLLPIADKLLNIGKVIENNYRENGNLDKEKYKETVEEIEKVNTLLTEIYYIPNSEGKVNLK
ncbi:hypothetical protein [Ureibacillus sinduriensis]|uniref:Uncharacterized protein n=1 Tax=Ureibacillus sinduriensis BLB-1 = JCM 15800 TaxID=1384057 RepID=A0A0A3I3F9_9BACL|nr:hypothetical protein [Ureibacillus sinduriensis]KGR79259.1 hypothetical protein CD33_00500 [Ureibacillus sinduriensis BLB-1 = JCM 15800]